MAIKKETLHPQDNHNDDIYPKTSIDQVEGLDERLNNLDQVDEQQGQTIQEQGQTIQEQGQTIQEQGKTIQEQGQTIERHSQSLFNLNQSFNSHSSALVQHGLEIEQNGTEIENLQNSKLNKIEVSLNGLKQSGFQGLDQTYPEITSDRIYALDYNSNTGSLIQTSKIGATYPASWEHCRRYRNGEILVPNKIQYGNSAVPRNFFTGASNEIDCTITENNIKYSLNPSVRNKINRALLSPVSAPVEDSVVVIGTNNSQELIPMTQFQSQIQGIQLYKTTIHLHGNTDTLSSGLTAKLCCYFDVYTYENIETLYNGNILNIFNILLKLKTITCNGFASYKKAGVMLETHKIYAIKFLGLNNSSINVSIYYEKTLEDETPTISSTDISFDIDYSLTSVNSVKIL